VDILWLYLEEIPPATAKPEVGVVCATAVMIKADQPMYYCACPEVWPSPVSLYVYL
jgi:hypothetical protein